MTCKRRPHAVWTTCTCPPCRTDSNRMAKLSRNGRYQRVPSEVAWAEVDRLRALGWSSAAIASSAGLAHHSIETALQDRRNNGGHEFGPHHAAALVGHGDPTEGRVGVTGSRRRLQGLARQGWDLQRIADMTGLGFSTLASIRNGRTEHCSAVAYIAIRDLAERLTMSIGPSHAGRMHAEKQGWPGLLAWDDIDDITERRTRPASRQRLKPGQQRKHDHIDEHKVDRILGGEKLPTTRAEKEEVLRRWVADGGSERDMCRRMGWREGRYVAAHGDQGPSTNQLQRILRQRFDGCHECGRLLVPIGEARALYRRAADRARKNGADTDAVAAEARLRRLLVELHEHQADHAREAS